MKKILFILITLCLAAAAHAQSKIDKVIEEIEKQDDVSVTYSERRSVKSKKLYRITRILNFDNKKYYAKLVKAFEDERGNTISATKDKTSFVYRFASKRTRSSYTLSQNNRGQYSLVMSWSDDSVPDDSGDSSMTTYYEDANGNFICTSAIANTEQQRQWAEQQRQWAEQQRQWAEQQRQWAEQQRKQAQEQRKQIAEQQKQQRLQQKKQRI